MGLSFHMTTLIEIAVRMQFHLRQSTYVRTVSVHAPEKIERLLVVYENGTNLGRYNFNQLQTYTNACFCLHEEDMKREAGIK